LLQVRKMQAAIPISTTRPLLPLSGGRIVLRRLTTGDVRAFQAYRTDPEVGRWQGWQPMTGTEALAFLAEMRQAPLFVPGHWNQIGIALREDDPEAPSHLIGDIGLLLREGDPTRAEIGFTLSALWQGRGLATEAVSAARELAFECAGVTRLEAVTDTRNDASIRLLERLGFRRERTMDAMFRGGPCREHHYASERGAAPGARPIP
jgi:aminoglycoside 6'-N-acetyltransferase